MLTVVIEGCIRRRLALYGFALLLSLFCGSVATAQKKVFPRQAGFSPSFTGMVSFQGRVYYAARHPELGFEPWSASPRSGAVTIGDINTNGDSSPQEWAEYGNTLFFQAESNETGRELWSYSSSGVLRLAADVNPGSGSSSPAALHVFADRLYFSANSTPVHRRLWVYDGENPPEVVPYGSQFAEGPADMIEFEGALYFTAELDDERIWWRFNGIGTPEPAFQDDILTWNGAHYPVLFDEKLIFSARPSGRAFNELWSYDGNGKPARIVTNPPYERFSTSAEFMTVYKDKLYYAASDDGDVTLWVYDGENQPIKVPDLEPYGSADPENLWVFGDSLFFTTGALAWSYDGESTPRLMNEIADLAPTDFHVENDVMYLNIPQGAHGQLWAYEETGLPYRLGGDALPVPSNPDHLFEHNDELYFSSDARRDNVWKLSDGDLTSVLIPQDAASYRDPSAFTDWSGSIWFLAEDATDAGSIPRTLFRYNGDDTIMEIGPIAFGNASQVGYPNRIVPFQDALFFGGRSENSGYELWRYDGVGAPGPVADINPAGDSFPKFLVVYRDALYFFADDGNHHGLWRYADSSDLEFITETAIQSEMRVFMDLLVFSADGLLWTYDPDRSQPLRSFNNSAGPEDQYNLNPENLTIAGGRMFMSGYDGSASVRLWEFDGETAPSMVGNLLSFETVDDMASFGRLICFSGDDAETGREFWCYDPLDMTAYTRNMWVGSDSDPADFVVSEDELYFSAADDSGPREMWRFVVDPTSFFPAHQEVPNAAGNDDRSSMAYPNPTAGYVRMAFRVDQSQEVRVILYDALGRQTGDTKSVHVQEGVSRVIELDLTNFSAGIYFCRISGEGFTEVRSIIRTN